MLSPERPRGVSGQARPAAGAGAAGSGTRPGSAALRDRQRRPNRPFHPGGDGVHDGGAGALRDPGGCGAAGGRDRGSGACAGGGAGERGQRGGRDHPGHGSGPSRREPVHQPRSLCRRAGGGDGRGAAGAGAGDLPENAQRGQRRLLSAGGHVVPGGGGGGGAVPPEGRGYGGCGGIHPRRGAGQRPAGPAEQLFHPAA